MVQSNPVQRDTEGAIEGVCIKGVSAPGGEYSAFQVTGMIKGLFGFEIFDFGIFLGRKILASYLFGLLDFAGIFLDIQNLCFYFLECQRKCIFQGSLSLHSYVRASPTNPKYAQQPQ